VDALAGVAIFGALFVLLISGAEAHLRSMENPYGRLHTDEQVAIKELMTIDGAVPKAIANEFMKDPVSVYRREYKIVIRNAAQICSKMHPDHIQSFKAECETAARHSAILDKPLMVVGWLEDVKAYVGAAWVAVNSR
jgi:hypothetical protein